MKVYSIPTLMIAAICLTTAVNDTLAWYRREKRKVDLAFVLICLSGTAFCLFCSGEYSVDLSAKSVFWLKGQTISITAAEFALFWFVAEETGLIGRRCIALCLGWTVLAALSQVLDLGALAWDAGRPFTLRVELPLGLDFVCIEAEAGPVLFVLNAVGFALLLYLMLVVAKYRRGGHRRESLVLFLILGIIVAAEVSDFLVGLGAYRFVFLMEYAWIASILFVGLRRSNEFFEAEERMRRSLIEKEILVREVYHRTKNNMSIIIAILKLQANEMGDERLKEAFATSIDRIMSMALVHDKLYRTDDLVRVDLRDYVEDLAAELVASCSLPGKQPSVVFETASLPVMIDTAVDCGLILNELITNSLKYAFPDGRKGEIRIGLGRDEEGWIRLALSDDGVGPPPGFDLERDGHLGLRLIRSLAKGKLKAELEFGGEKGFSCSMRFMEEPGPKNGKGRPGDTRAALTAR